MMTLKKTKRRFFNNEDGSMTTMIAIVLPVLIGFGVLAVDVGHYYATKTKVQQAADISGLSVLTKMRDEERIDFLSVSDATARYRTDAVAMARKNMPAFANNQAVKEHDVLFGKWDFNRKVFIPLGNRFPANAVRVNARMTAGRSNPVKALFGKIFLDHVDLNVSSVAVMPIPPGFHLLSPDASGALEMHGFADIDVWTVQVNSTADDAFNYSARAGGIGAAHVGVVGDAPGVSHSAVQTDVNPVGDFLENLPEPVVGPCTETGFVTSGLNPPDLEPGVYCDGLTITDANEVTLKPGTYVIKGGPLTLDASMRDKPIKGDGVLIYLADEKAELRMHGGDFSIRATRTGPWAGVALMAARGAKAPPNLLFANTRLFASGIIYVPDSKVELVGGIFNGVCRYLCFVSDTLKMTNTFANYGHFRTSSANPFGDTTILPEEPPTLKENFRPFIVEKAPFGFF